MTFPFEVSFEHIQANPDAYIQAVFACLVSDFLVLPRGRGFIEYSVFEHGYEALKRATSGFREVTPVTLESVVADNPIALIVLRAMLGFTPPEWAYMATQRTGFALAKVRFGHWTVKSVWNPHSPWVKAKSQEKEYARFSKWHANS